MAKQRQAAVSLHFKCIDLLVRRVLSPTPAFKRARDALHLGRLGITSKLNVFSLPSLVSLHCGRGWVAGKRKVESQADPQIVEAPKSKVCKVRFQRAKAVLIYLGFYQTARSTTGRWSSWYFQLERAHSGHKTSQMPTCRLSLPSSVDNYLRCNYQTVVTLTLLRV